jgi:hypothetical protein
MVNLGKEVIFFGDSTCPACRKQKEILDTYYNSKGTTKTVKYHDLGKLDPPKEILLKDGSYAMPTWYFPDKPLIRGIISGPELEKNVKRPWRFGSKASDLTFESIPQIDSLVKYGKNFPNGNGFEINNSWTEQTKKQWGNDVTTSGTLGREFGPGGFDKTLSNEYLYKPRGPRPGDDLDTALNLNRSCGILGKPGSIQNSLGLIFDSKNQQIVPMNNFGRRKTKFGNLYNQMGPAFERGNQYLIGKDTVMNLYGGATQNEPPRPGKVNNNLSYIGKAKEYTPLQNNNYGRKKRTSKIGEGSVLTLKNKKISVN